MNRRVVILLLAASLLTGCGGSARPAGTGTEPTKAPEQVANGPVATPLTYEAYKPVAEEKYPNAKRLAARVAQRAITYARGSTAAEVARSVPGSDQDTRALARVIDPLVDPAMRSGGEVVYPQLSGVTATSLGAMVVVRQVLEDAAGRRRVERRVLDVRLRRADGPWELDSIVSVGGERRTRPQRVSAAAGRVLDHDRITLSDSARWDVYRGAVDEALLRRLADLADQYPFSVSVLISGHPRNVWKTERRSAHTDGFAADIYAVGGRLVTRQQRPGSPAYRLARQAVSGGARQVGSPWTFGPRGFADDVHLDHVHIQQTAVPVQPG